MNEAKFSGRRVVTRMNEQGRSVIGLDGPPALLMAVLIDKTFST